MIKKHHRFGVAVRQSTTAFTTGLTVIFLAASCYYSAAWSRYKNNSGTGNCSTCHGDFTDGTSPQGTIFPSNDKHEMHRASNSMDADCNLCHTTGDNFNPYLSSSNGTANNAGLGCLGCHSGAGMRLHHEVNGIDVCANCHDAETAPVESTKPPYYGTVDTKVNNACNPVSVANTNENWSIGDFLGLDNDGNNLYDAADSACGSPTYEIKMLSAGREGNDLRITWQTAGGKTDVLQAAGAATGPYTNVSPAISTTGSGVVTTNYVDVGAATNQTRFYRVTGQP